eukprot:gene8504-10454_t
MLFCPLCANMLLVEPDIVGTKYFCQTCPYIFEVRNKVTSKVALARKQIESDVFGGDEAWFQSQQVEEEHILLKFKLILLVSRKPHISDVPDAHCNGKETNLGPIPPKSLLHNLLVLLNTLSDFIKNNYEDEEEEYTF